MPTSSVANPENDPIQHVVVLMLENRSFDHMLGSLQSFYPHLRGIDPAHPGTNTEGTQTYAQTPDALFQLPYGVDPKHDWPDVVEQLTFNGPCGGFVHNFVRSYPDKKQHAPQVMSYFDRLGQSRLPVLHTLAESFALCEQWFASVPGPTWPNRFFVHSATSHGWVDMPSGPFNHWHTYNQATLYDRLNEKGISWKIYFDDVPQSLMLVNQRKPQNRARYDLMRTFFKDAAGAEPAFPHYSFIEPCYFGGLANDQHPPSNVLAGEVLIAKVYNALRANDALWKKTLLVLLYDEHGGFYDPVQPPAATPPDSFAGDGYGFDGFGLRVPALLISPYAPQEVVTTVLDHTSLLRYVIDKWHLGELTLRSKAANTFQAVLLTQAREDTPAHLPEPHFVLPKGLEPGVHPPLNDLQATLLSFTQMLEAEIPDAPQQKAERLLRSVQGVEEQVAVGRERVLKFLGKSHASQPEGSQ